MRSLKISGLLIISISIALHCFAADKEAADRAKTKEKLTVIRPGPDGEIRVLSKEIVTDRDAKTVRPRREVKADTSPRKARIAVVPAVYAQDLRSRSNRELNEKFGITDPGIIENPGYTGFLVDALVNCRKFDVMEREDLSSATRELDLGESEYADIEKAVRLGRVLNADYVIIPEIRFVEFRAARSIPYIGRTGKRLEGRVDVSLRTVDVSTSRLVSSYMYSTKLRRSRKRDESNASLVAGLRGQLYKRSSMEGVANVIDVVYPIKIIAVEDYTCVLNRGSGAIVEGEILSVYKPGEVLIDPDTNETLGYHEALVGKVKVTEVKAKIAIAEIVEGKVRKLYICRREGKAGEVPVSAPKID